MLNASTSDPSSSLVSGSSQTSNSPAPMARAPSASFCTGRVIRFARYRPSHVAASRISSVTVKNSETYTPWSSGL